MNLDEVKDSVKDFVDTRLKNPYFASVIAVWVVTNRVLLFGIFNFDDTINFKERINWAYAEFQNFKLLNLIGLHGFTATIVWSLLMGYFVMAIYNKVGGLAKWLYIKINRGTINFIQKVEPSKWIEKSKFDEIFKSNSSNVEELNRKRLEYNAVQKEYESLNGRFLQLEKDRNDKEIVISTNSETLAVQSEQLRQINEERNKFKINYARYGKYDTYIEVTKTISDLLTKNGSFSVENSVLGFDPYKYKVKELYIEFQYNSKTETLLANENEMVELKDNEFTIIQTEDSKTKQKWIERQIILANIFNGNWELTYTKDNISTKEKIKIDETASYYANDIKSFDLQIIELDDRQIIFRKLNLDGVEHSVETLGRNSKDLISGTDSKGHFISYERNLSNNIIA